MMAGCRCLKENLDELRIESVRYGRVTGKPESDSGPEIGIWEGGGSIRSLQFPADHGMTDIPKEFCLRLVHGGRPLHGHEFRCQTSEGNFQLRTLWVVTLCSLQPTIARTLFTLEWLQNPELRRRVSAGLNKSEAKNALTRAVFFNRLGELRDRSFEDQRYRASGLNLVVAAIVAWNTVYLERAVASLSGQKTEIRPELLAHISPLGWEHIGLTGDYTWHESKRVAQGRFRPLRVPSETNLWS
jgi:hypothetical protein